MYFGGSVNWKRITCQWQIGRLWGFHCRYFWIIRWELPNDQGHKRIIGSKGYR